MRMMIDEKYGISSDDNQFILFELKVRGEAAKDAGAEFDSPLGYYGTLQASLKGYAKYSVRHSDVKGMKELRAQLDAIEKAIMNVKVK